nr:MAG TPA: hypothetical protein [Caudoviricetes sp.]
MVKCVIRCSILTHFKTAPKGGRMKLFCTL